MPAETDAQTQTEGVILTEDAAKEIRNIIAEQELDADKVRLRVGVKGGGCSGFTYVLDLTETERDSDEVFTQHGIKVVCDPKSLLYLNGTTISFRDEIMKRLRLREPQRLHNLRLRLQLLRLTPTSPRHHINHSRTTSPTPCGDFSCLHPPGSANLAPVAGRSASTDEPNKTGKYE